MSSRPATPAVNRFRYLPKGGTAGQIMVKASSDNYDLVWGDPATTGSDILENLPTDPVSPATGQIWLNTTEDVIKYYDGTSILPLAGGGGNSYNPGGW